MMPRKRWWRPDTVEYCACTPGTPLYAPRYSRKRARATTAETTSMRIRSLDMQSESAASRVAGRLYYFPSHVNTSDGRWPLSYPQDHEDQSYNPRERERNGRYRGRDLARKEIKQRDLIFVPVSFFFFYKSLLIPVSLYIHSRWLLHSRLFHSTITRGLSNGNSFEKR